MTQKTRNVPDQANEELTWVSLFESEFSIDWLLEVTGAKASQILGWLETEVKNGTLASKSQGKYIFHDQKRRQELRDRLTAGEKETYHREIAKIIQRELPDEQSAAVEIANQLMAVSNQVEGCTWLFKAAKAHQVAFRSELALDCYKKITQDLVDSKGEEADILYMDSAISYSKNSTARIDPAEVISILEKAQQRAMSRNDRSRQALIEMHLAKNEWLQNRTEASQKHFQTGIDLAKGIGDEKLHRSILSFKLWFNYWFGRYEDAVKEYKKHIPDIDRYPTTQFPMLTSIILGNCLGFSGYYNQGLGMLNALYHHCLKIGDTPNAAMAELGLGNALVHMRKLEEALPYLQNALKLGERIKNNWVTISAHMLLSFLYYLTGETDKSLKYLKKWYRSSKNVGMGGRLYTGAIPGTMELFWAMKQGKYPAIDGLDPEDEIEFAINGEGPLAKGIAYRYKALFRRQDGESEKNIKKYLDSSIEFLKMSGCEVELALTGIEISRYYVKQGQKKKASEWAAFADELVSKFNRSLIPDDLRYLVNQELPDKNLLKEILAQGQEVVSIRENKEVVNNILSTANRITGAERGAIFMLEPKSESQNLYLRAAKNLTVEEVAEDDFRLSMEMIRQTAKTKEGKINTVGKENKTKKLPRSRILSSICIPMIIRGKLVGVLYHDNRLFAAVFEERVMEILSYFAALAAIALDNAKAYEEIKVLNERLGEEKKYYEEQQFEDVYSEEIIGKSTGIKKVIATVQKVSDSATTVLILGETGVGKELVASAIHRRSPRRDKPFICVHCSALPESLISSELFGHEKGAFTGAISRRTGRFELANGGTLFLDEIGELPMEVQVRLLRILQTKEFERVGGSQTLRSDFRLIAATNRDLAKEVRAKRFRKDLYYRLNVFPIEVPPLRNRTGDIPLLAHYFLKIHSDKLKKPVSKIAQPVMEHLTTYEWPGNVRELENVIERGIILSTGTSFRMPELGATQLDHSSDKAVLTLEENEKVMILKALKMTGGKINGKGGAAELLKVNRNTLYYRMKKLGIKKKNI